MFVTTSNISYMLSQSLCKPSASFSYVLDILGGRFGTWYTIYNVKRITGDYSLWIFNTYSLNELSTVVVTRRKWQVLHPCLLHLRVPPSFLCFAWKFCSNNQTLKGWISRLSVGNQGGTWRKTFFIDLSFTRTFQALIKMLGKESKPGLSLDERFIAMSTIEGRNIYFLLNPKV